MKNRLKKLRDLLTKNWGLKIIAVLLSFLIWFSVAQIENPTKPISFGSIKVTMVNTDILTDQSKVYEILDNTDTTRVTVIAPESVLEGLTASDILAEADFSKLTEDNLVPVTYSLSTDAKADTITGTVEYVKVKIEDRVSKNVSLTATITGDVADNYMLGNILLDQNIVQVFGPKSAIGKVHHAGVEIDVTDADTSLSANLDIILYDSKGNPITDTTLTKQTDYAHISIEVLPIKTVPIQVSFTGAAADGYAATGDIILSQTSVKVAAAATALAQITRVAVSDIDISGITETTEYSFNLEDYLPGYAVLADASFDGTVTAQIVVEETVTKTVEIPVENVSITDVPEGLSAEYVPMSGSAFRITVRGLQKTLDALDISRITAQVDMKAYMDSYNTDTLLKGLYFVDMKVTLPTGLTLEEPVQAKVTLEEAAEE